MTLVRRTCNHHELRPRRDEEPFDHSHLEEAFSLHRQQYMTSVRHVPLLNAQSGKDALPKPPSYVCKLAMNSGTPSNSSGVSRLSKVATASRQYSPLH